MQTTRLGATGQVVSTHALGTMTFGNQTSPQDAFRQLDLARDHAITLIDMAEMYPVNPVRAETLGRTEEIVGDWLAARRPAGMVLATKVTGEGSAVMAGGTPMITPARLRSAVEAALVRLKTDHIHLYQLHWPNRGSYHFRQNWTWTPPRQPVSAIRDDIRALLIEAAALIAEGKIGQLGLSNESAWGLTTWLEIARTDRLPAVGAIQNEYSLLCRLADTDLAEVCALEQVPLLAWSPLAAGLLTGKYVGDVTPAGSRRSLTASLGQRITPRAVAAVDAYLDVARSHGLDPIHMALAWIRSRPFPAVPILGATTSVQLERQLPAIALELDPAVVKAIDTVHRAHPMPF